MSAPSDRHTLVMHDSRAGLDLADVVFGTAWGVARLSGRLAAKVAGITAPALGLALPTASGAAPPATGLRGAGAGAVAD